jgi:hypothetical protein
MRGLLARISTRNAARIVTTLVVTTLLVALVQAQLAGRGTVGATAASGGIAPNAVGTLDCNGLSPIQKPNRHDFACTDMHAFYDGKPSRFSDNGHYVGHDEPSIRFLSSVPGSGTT